MRITLALMLCVVIGLSGCGRLPRLGGGEELPHIQLRPINTAFVEEKPRIEANYAFNKLLTAYVGEPVVKRRKMQQTVQSELHVVPLMPVTVASGGYQVQLQENQHYPIKYETFVNSIRYTAADIPSGQDMLTLLFDENGMVLDRMFVNGIMQRDTVRITPINARVNFSRPERVLSSAVVENFEIVFSGASGDQIRFTYREYSPDNVARTAFFQELTYPRDAEFVRYKSLKIRLQQITSEGLIYEVVTD